MHEIQIDPVTEIQLKIRAVMKNNLAKTNMVQNLKEQYLNLIHNMQDLLKQGKKQFEKDIKGINEVM